MTNNNNVWSLVLESLGSKLTRNEIKTWFSHTTCNKLDNNLAIIEVPNKFVARWLKDNYLNEINYSFKKVLKETPEISFEFNNKHSSFLSKNLDKKDKEVIYFNNNLNKSMVFDDYISGECNKFAYSSAIEVSEKPGTYYNPLYIFSDISIGKTHLLNAIGNNILKKDKKLKVCYVHSKSFASEFNFLLRNNNLDNFKKRYHNLDVLLFDDIHYLTNKNKIQEEFLSIFNDIHGEKKQIVITGDRSPNQLKKINAQLKSRLGWGLIVEIKDFDSKTKLEIINKKLKENNKYKIPNDVISLLLKSNNNIKNLLKNIIRVETYLSLNNGNINISLIKSIIKERDNKNITGKDIQVIISKYFNITISDIISNKKKTKFSYPRHIAMYLSRKYTELSYKEIGYIFGDRDHSTVIYAIRKIEKTKIKNKDLRDDLNNIENLLI